MKCRMKFVVLLSGLILLFTTSTAYAMTETYVRWLAFDTCGSNTYLNGGDEIYSDWSERKELRNYIELYKDGILMGTKAGSDTSNPFDVSSKITTCLHPWPGHDYTLIWNEKFLSYNSSIDAHMSGAEYY